MAKRILSANSALKPGNQMALGSAGSAGSATPSVRTESRGPVFQQITERWREALAADPNELLFDWQDQADLMREIEFINKAHTLLDEASMKIAPAMLRVVLTVKENMESPKEQRAFLAENLELDFRRISELCIVADSYRLLDLQWRDAGEREIHRYGWSKALKLAHVHDPDDRKDIWQRACGDKSIGSYRDVLEEISRYRNRKLIAPPSEAEEVELKIMGVREKYKAFESLTRELNSSDNFSHAIKSLSQLQRELNALKKSLKDRMETADVESMAATA